MSSEMTPGSVGWHDLTVDDAPAVRDFYAAVCGWTASEHPMDGYSDYVMSGPDGTAVGVCHARGGNAGLPAQWLMYVVTADITAAQAEVVARGGTVIRPPKEPGKGFAVVQDPAGAVFALYQQGGG